jgi:primosomal protein N' (replication factor Y)
VVLHFRKREKKSLFHQDSLHFFEKTLFSGGRAAIIHARKGYARFLACATCGSRLLCPECETPLLAQTSKVLFCSHDRKTFPLPSSCSECGGKKWRYSMEGIEKYNEFLNRQYPSFRIVSFESHFSKPPSCDILLGTIGMEEILSQFSPGILLIPDGDSFVARAGFKSEERFFLAIQRMRKRLPENALVFIQSSNNEIALFHALTKDNPEIFYTSEGRIRKKLHFPPFSHFLKIIPGRKIGKEKEELLESFIPSLGDIYDASFSRGAKKAFLLKTDFPQKHIEEIISFCDRKKIPVSFDVDPYE